jgi:hypothetical protein
VVNDDTNNSGGHIVCQVCGQKNLPGTLLCNNCGAMLKADIGKRSGTRDLNDVLPELQTSRVFTTVGTSTFQSGMLLKLEITDQNAQMEVDPSRRQLIVGRRDPVSRRKPDIDLEDFDGYRMGVSRKHAVFSYRSGELALQDYGSANGTFLNGVRLPAHQAHKVHDGDAIRLGHLLMRVYFVDVG